jgi:hypothetical protein
MSCTIAPGGVGKSSLEIGEAISMTTGRNLIGYAPAHPLNVWYWNGEDPAEEIERRIAAIMLYYHVDPSEIEGRLFVDSGRDTGIVIASKTRNGVIIAHPVIEEIIATIRENSIDAFVVDPFVRSHAVTENDNSEIEIVAAQWAEIADRGNCAVELVHHSRKTGGGEVTVEHSRGGIALIDKSRSARVLNQMTREEADRVDIKHPGFYFRVDNGKANLAPPSEKAAWHCLNSVSLGNGSGEALDDHVQVVTAWTMPDPLAAMTADGLIAAQLAVSQGGPWRESAQAANWVGKPIAAALGLDLANKAHREKVKIILKAWMDKGLFVITEGRDEARIARKFVEVGNRVQ